MPAIIQLLTELDGKVVVALIDFHLLLRSDRANQHELLWAVKEVRWIILVAHRMLIRTAHSSLFLAPLPPAFYAQLCAHCTLILSISHSVSSSKAKGKGSGGDEAVIKVRCTYVG